MDSGIMRNMLIFPSLQEVCNILFTVRIITIIPCVNLMLSPEVGGNQLLNQSKSYFSSGFCSGCATRNLKKNGGVSTSDFT